MIPSALTWAAVARHRLGKSARGALHEYTQSYPASKTGCRILSSSSRTDLLSLFMIVKNPASVGMGTCLVRWPPQLFVSTSIALVVSSAASGARMAWIISLRHRAMSYANAYTNRCGMHVPKSPMLHAYKSVLLVAPALVNSRRNIYNSRSDASQVRCMVSLPFEK